MDPSKRWFSIAMLVYQPVSDTSPKANMTRWILSTPDLWISLNFSTPDLALIDALPVHAKSEYIYGIIKNWNFIKKSSGAMKLPIWLDQTVQMNGDFEGFPYK